MAGETAGDEPDFMPGFMEEIVRTAGQIDHRLDDIMALAKSEKSAPEGLPQESEADEPSMMDDTAGLPMTTNDVTGSSQVDDDAEACIHEESRLVQVNEMQYSPHLKVMDAFKTPVDRTSAEESASDEKSTGSTGHELSFRMASDASSAPNPETGLGIVTGSAIVINYISAGYILLPWGFSKGGVLLSSLVLAFVAYQSYLTSVFLLEAAARAELVDRRFSMRGINRRGLRASFSSAESSSHGFFLSSDVFKGIQSQSHELSELCRIFLGPNVRNFFTLTTAFDLYGITWTFAAVFASALSEHLPMGASNVSDYNMYMLIFAAIAVPLSCVSILDQLILQLIFLAARTLMVFLMIGTLVDAYIHNDVPSFGDQAGPVGDVPLFDFRNTVTTFQVAIFSTAFQFAVPGIADQCKEKSTVPKMVVSIGVRYVFATNLVLAIMASIFFGRSSTSESSNLNWLNYHGSTFDEENDSNSKFASIVSSYIVLFAAVDGLAVFPLVSLSLGEILMCAVHGENTANQSWKVQVLYRLAGSIPQLVGAMFVSDLGVISKYAGIFTLLSYTTCPALLHLKSRKVMPRLSFCIPKRSRIKMWVLAWLLVAFSLVLIAGVIVESLFVSTEE